MALVRPDGVGYALLPPCPLVSHPSVPSPQSHYRGARATILAPEDADVDLDATYCARFADPKVWDCIQLRNLLPALDPTMVWHALQCSIGPPAGVVINYQSMSWLMHMTSPRGFVICLPGFVQD